MEGVAQHLTAQSTTQAPPAADQIARQRAPPARVGRQNGEQGPARKRQRLDLGEAELAALAALVAEGLQGAAAALQQQQVQVPAQVLGQARAALSTRHQLASADVAFSAGQLWPAALPSPSQKTRGSATGSIAPTPRGGGSPTWAAAQALADAAAEGAAATPAAAAADEGTRAAPAAAAARAEGAAASTRAAAAGVDAWAAAAQHEVDSRLVPRVAPPATAALQPAAHPSTAPGSGGAAALLPQGSQRPVTEGRKQPSFLSRQVAAQLRSNSPMVTLQIPRDAFLRWLLQRAQQAAVPHAAGQPAQQAVQQLAQQPAQQAAQAVPAAAPALLTAQPLFGMQWQGEQQPWQQQQWQAPPQQPQQPLWQPGAPQQAQPFRPVHLPQQAAWLQQQP